MPGKPWKQKAKTLITFSGLQTLVHGVMALSGFLIIRVLSKSEYAAYTIAASLQTLLNALTDCGIGWGMNAVGGRIWNDPGRLRGLIATSLRLRSYLAIMAVPMTVLSAFYLLRKNAVSWPTTAALTGGVVATLWGTFLTTIYAAPLRLRALYTLVQKFDLFGAVLRFVLLAIVASFFLNAISAVLITAITLAVQGTLLRRGAEKNLADEVKEEDSDRRALIGLMKKQALATLFFAYQGQITIWVMSVFGSTEKVADLGALTRLSIIFALVTSILTGLVAPTFARCESLDRLLRLFGIAVAVYLAFAALLFFCGLAFPRELLWVLGGKYETLTRELPFLIAGAIVGGTISVIYTLAASRGWVWQTWIIPIVTIVTQAATAPLFNLRTVIGVLLFGLVSLIPTLGVIAYMGTRGVYVSWKTGKLATVAT